MEDFKDAKGFIITFTCNTCPFAIAYEDRIIELNNKYASKGYPVIAIMPNNTDVKPGDNMEAMKVRAKSKGFTFPYLIDAGQKVYPKFGATKTPHVYVLEKTKKGNVVKYIGAIDDNHRDASAVKVKFVENAVNALLAGKEVKQPTTKAIGCSIKA
jgi:glutathione peroxidase-family protein